MTKRAPRPKPATRKANEERLLPLITAAAGAAAGGAVWFFLVRSSLAFAPDDFRRMVFLGVVVCAAVASLAGGFFAQRSTRSMPIRVLSACIIGLAFALAYPVLFLGRDVNVLLIVSDATRADHLRCYGYPKDTSPNLDAFAGEGVLLGQAIAQGTHTIVASPCILASLYPSQHGLATYRDVLPEAARTIAEVLRDEGYRTFGVSTNPHLTETTGFAQGFDTFDADSAWLNTDASRVVDRFLSWLETGPGTPFFAFLFFIDPHSPYEPPAEILEKFGGDPAFTVRDWSLDSLKTYDARGRREIIARYDAEIAYFDREIGRLFAGLKERGMYENTLIVYTSDHGEAFWEHGRVGHGDSLYEELLRVPLLLKLPALFGFPRLAPPSGAEKGEPVGQIDVMPTVLEFVGAEIPAEVQGMSLLPLLYRGEYPEERPIFSEEILLQLGPYNLRSIRIGRWKLIVDHDLRRGEVHKELYDLAADPGETENLIDARKEEAKGLERELLVFMGRMERSRIVSGAPNVPTKSMLESLKALGYIE